MKQKKINVYLQAVKATRSRITTSILRCLLVDDQIFYESNHLVGVYITVHCMWVDENISPQR